MAWAVPKNTCAVPVAGKTVGVIVGDEVIIGTGSSITTAVVDRTPDPTGCGVSTAAVVEFAAMVWAMTVWTSSALGILDSVEQPVRINKHINKK
jgi:hypothetical protein